MAPAGIEPATFRFVAQHLNHCATAVPLITMVFLYIVLMYVLYLLYRGADKSLALPGWKEAAPAKSVMGRGMD